MLLDVSGTEHRFTNIVTFAEQHGLNSTQVSNLLRGLCARYGGFHRSGVCLDKYHQSSELKTVLAPDGSEYSFYNTAAFCREHDLTVSSLQRVVSGVCKQHKGWQLKTAESKPKDYRWKNEGNSHKRYASIVLERDGERFTITNDIRQFCARHGLRTGEVYTLTSGSQKTTHGFRLVLFTYTDVYLVKHPELVAA